MVAARGTYAKTAEVQRGILEACIGLIAQMGFRGLTMAAVARRAGISHTGLLHHFPSKEDLLTGVIALQDARAQAYIAESVDLDPDPLTTLRGLLSALAFRQAGLVELSVMLSAEASSTTHPGHDHFRQRYRATRRFLADRLETLRRSARLTSAVDSTQLAAATIALVEGLSTQWLYEPDEIDIDAAIIGVLAAFIPELAEQHPAHDAAARGSGSLSP